MTAVESAHTASTNLGYIETSVKQGKATISADDTSLIKLVMSAINDGITATFYLKPIVFREIRRRYWTKERLEQAELQSLPGDEADRIESDFGLKLDGASSVEHCPRCQASYGTYEFIQQGVKEHGREAVEAVFALEGVAVLQVHPRQNITCQKCGLDLSLMARLPIVISGHSYDYWRPNGNAYACCM